MLIFETKDHDENYFDEFLFKLIGVNSKEQTNFIFDNIENKANVQHKIFVIENDKVKISCQIIIKNTNLEYMENSLVYKIGYQK